MQLEAERFAEIVAAAIKSATEPLKDRIATLEHRLAAFKGEKGDPGEKGERGDRGERGDQGVAGERGEPGSMGERGERGERGDPGLQGERGAAGEAGAVGERGANGLDGRDGINGKDGRDGLSFEHLDVKFDGENTFTFSAQNGDYKKEWTFTVPAMVYRGIWREGSYKAGNTVTTGGSLWVALRDTTEKPGLSKDWQLCVKKGADGKTGPTGPEGKQGPRGERGERGPDRF